jgi:translocation and assembly module TamB
MLRWAGVLVAALMALVLATVAFLHTAPGRQFIVDQVAGIAPASGLTVQVGRIEGSVLWSSTLYDVRFRDAKGRLFLQVPEIDLNWRPLSFPWRGLDVRHLVLRRGTLFAAPDLLPGDPDAPTLPDFDIKVDRFIIDDLTVAKGLLGAERKIDFHATAKVKDGLVYLDSGGDLGGGDMVRALVHAEPDGNRFDMDVDYRAPRGGLLATLAGAKDSLRVRLAGDGTWQKWDGHLVVNQGSGIIGALKISNRAGRYKGVGQLRPAGYVTGLPAAALGPLVDVAAIGTLKDSVLDGSFALRGRGLRADASGAIDLGRNAVRAVKVDAALVDPRLFGTGLVLDDARLKATVDGPFRDLTVPHELTIGRMTAGTTVLAGLAQRGTLRWTGARATLPLAASVQRITSGNALIDPQLVNGRVGGTLTYGGGRLESRSLAVAFPGLDATLALTGDLARNAWGLAGPVRARGLPLQNLGTVDAGADVQFRVGANQPWLLSADFRGTMPRVTNATLANVAGTGIRFAGGVTLGAGRPIDFRRTTLNASKLVLTVDGSVNNGVTTLAGNGRHTQYGAFTVQATMAGDGPRAQLVFASPYPAAGLRDVAIALAPTPDGFEIKTNGQSTLGPFDGLLNLVSPAGGPTRLAIQRLDVWKTSVSGAITLLDGGVSGDLRLAGGGLDGTVALKPQSGGQGFTVQLTARDASFNGATPISVREADIAANGVLGDATTVQGSVRAAGISYGSLFLGRVAARAEVANGRGSFNASLAGRRGSRFELQLTGDAAPDRISLAARGTYGQRPIAMPRRAVLLKAADGGWQLQQTQLSFGGGFALVDGHFGGDRPAQGKLALANMPLSLLDIAMDKVSLGGTISGIVDFGAGPGGVPTGEARVMVRRLTRSGLVLTSRPVDIALVSNLSPSLLQARAVVREGGEVRGRLQGRIANLPQDGGLVERLNAGDLFAQLRYQGPADALWRLTGLELIDVTGPLQMAADVRGSLRQPTVVGSLAGDALRLQSGITGTDLRNLHTRGRFSGSRLELTSFAGTAPNGGQVSGSGFVDLANLGVGRGPQIDLRIAAQRAQIMNLPTMGATVTGPLRIVSSGVGGTIAGRLRVNEARWVLGKADQVAQLPDIRTREINLPADIAPPRRPGAPWRYLIDAAAPGGVKVDGMGLDSQWGADIRLRGTTAAPRIGGTATVVPRQGYYNFAGVRFELTRGRIDFDEAGPIDPRLNILAETKVDDLSVSVAITGSASQPDIAFNSVPALPQEELLARLLFGGSITNLSATDALQLGAAVASLRGGGGMDPINRLRTAIGLDRLRIVPADPALERGTAIALGKNFGRRFYLEIITDGRGYNASELEFRITGWLSLLASINTIGRGSATAEYSRDY